ncbi:MAG: hypothetical protein EB060_05755, partial [Proteobacteria bacterium]|nr:hypothetical protein [Pseudomonadota bacterium]
MRLAFLTILLSVLLFCGLSVARADDYEVVAIVNDAVISRKDVENRMQIILNSTALPDSEEIKKKVFPQLVQMLIDEALQKQEAAKLNLTITDKEIDRAVEELERQNGIAKGTFEQFIKAKKMPRTAVMDQIKTQLTWNKVLYKRVRPFIKVSDEEVADALLRYKAPENGKAEVNLAEIVLPVTTAKDEANVRALADKLYQQIQAGKDFGALAKEFSSSQSREKRGVVGWFFEDDLERNIRAGVKQIEKDQVTAPIRSSFGYHIMKVIDRRFVGSVKQEPPTND